jgi:coproporphyrinogen III oxidase-like Fe-S oxidoreductase
MEVRMYDSLYPVTYYFYPLLEDEIEQSPFKGEFLGMLKRPKPSPTENLLYVHIPYCHDLCAFCPFHVKVDSGGEVYGAYTEALCREAELVSSVRYVSEMQFHAVYFGGGSPSLLPPSDLRRIFETLFRCFDLAPNAEISFEGEPRTLGDPERQDLLKEFGVRRISFGLQTYDEEIRKLFKIVATLKDIDRCVANARDRKFEDINVDMMYDLPGQNVSHLEKDLLRLREHDFDSVDYYNLHYYAFSKKFKEGMDAGSIPSKPGEAMHFSLAEQLRWRMREYGYHNVADQIFAKEPKVSEYFRLLWGGGDGDHTAETVALGSSARGYLNGISYMNVGAVHKYQQMIGAGELPITKLSRRLLKAENRGAIFMAKFYKLDKARAEAMRSIPSEVWEKWGRDGLIYESGEVWRLSELGKRWTTNMMIDMFEAHQRDVAHNSLSFIAAKPGVRTGSF